MRQPKACAPSTSVWMRSSSGNRSFQPIDRDQSCHVCVVGAGMAGLSAAYHLAGEGRDVVVLDDGEIGGGETQRTTAHLANEIDDRYVDIIGTHGEEIARLAAESHTAAIATIERIAHDESIDCDFERVDGF